MGDLQVWYNGPAEIISFKVETTLNGQFHWCVQLTGNEKAAEYHYQ